MRIRKAHKSKTKYQGIIIFPQIQLVHSRRAKKRRRHDIAPLLGGLPIGGLVAVLVLFVRLLFMDVEAASVIEVFPAEEWELASFVVGDASIRGRGARAWASDGAEGGGEQEEEEPATAEDEFGGRPESTRAESSNQPEEIRPKSGWVGFVDFGDHAEGDDPGLQPERPRTRFGRGPKERKGRKRKERIRPADGGGVLVY